MTIAARATGFELRLARRFAQNPIALAAAIFFVRYLCDGLRDVWRGSNASLGHLANLGIFQLLAWMVTLHLVMRGGETARRSSITVGLICLCAALPDGNAPFVGLTVLAGYAFFTFPKNDHLRAAATVMLALAVQLFWGRLLFELVAFQIEVADARLAAGLLSLLHNSVSLQDNLIGTKDHQIVIYEACTSFHNISLAMLAWVAVTKFVRPQWRRSDLVTGLLLVIATVAMNSLRLFLMASSAPDMLDYWHVGAGSQMINASLSALIAILCLWGVRFRWTS